jgi:hypothetical protein
MIVLALKEEKLNHQGDQYQHYGEDGFFFPGIWWKIIMSVKVLKKFTYTLDN